MSDQTEHEDELVGDRLAEDETHADLEGSREADQTDAPTEDEEQPQDGYMQEATPQEWERRFTKAEAKFTTYRKAVAALWGDDAQYLQPFSLSPMAPAGFIDVRDAGRVPEEIKAVVLEFLGFAREQDYEPDPVTSECATCKGKGKTKTGSHVAGKETRACPDCHGLGATGLPPPGSAEATNGHADEPFTLAGPTASGVVDADNWGQPRILPDGRENPNHGKMPQYWVSVEPWGDTRNLTPQDAAV